MHSSVHASFSKCELFKVRAPGWNHCFVVMVVDRNNPEKSSVEQQHLPVIGATPPFWREEMTQKVQN